MKRLASLDGVLSVEHTPEVSFKIDWKKISILERAFQNEISLQSASDDQFLVKSHLGVAIASRLLLRFGMATTHFFDYSLIGLAAALAGIVDAVIGGGGMVQLPALFAILPSAVPAVLFGANKFSAAVGTTGAALQYARSVPPPWWILVPVATIAFFASVLGAYAILFVPADPLRRLLPFVLFVLLIYTLRSRIGLEHLPRHSRPVAVAIAGSGSALIGFYDGFFGAGTGAFYKLLFVRGLGYDFIHAAAPSKITNVASNIGAILVFILAGKMHWGLALWMALLNFAGGQVGSRVALRYGSGFIRRAFIVVVSALILKTFHDAYLH